MASKNDNVKIPAKQFVEQFVDRVLHLGEISYKKMFGGYGVFESGKMFALVTSEGGVYLKVVESNLARFQDAGSNKHGKMPYYQIPKQVWEDETRLLEWTREAIEISKFAK